MLEIDEEQIRAACNFIEQVQSHTGKRQTDAIDVKKHGDRFLRLCGSFAPKDFAAALHQFNNLESLTRPKAKANKKSSDDDEKEEASSDDEVEVLLPSSSPKRAADEEVEYEAPDDDHNDDDDEVQPPVKKAKSKVPCSGGQRGRELTPPSRRAVSILATWWRKRWPRWWHRSWKTT